MQQWTCTGGNHGEPLFFLKKKKVHVSTAKLTNDYQSIETHVALAHRRIRGARRYSAEPDSEPEVVRVEKHTKKKLLIFE